MKRYPVYTYLFLSLALNTFASDLRDSTVVPVAGSLNPLTDLQKKGIEAATRLELEKGNPQDNPQDILRAAQMTEAQEKGKLMSHLQKEQTEKRTHMNQEAQTQKDIQTAAQDVDKAALAVEEAKEKVMPQPTVAPQVKTQEDMVQEQVIAQHNVENAVKEARKKINGASTTHHIIN